MYQPGGPQADEIIIEFDFMWSGQQVIASLAPVMCLACAFVILQEGLRLSAGACAEHKGDCLGRYATSHNVTINDSADWHEACYNIHDSR